MEAVKQFDPFLFCAVGSGGSPGAAVRWCLSAAPYGRAPALRQCWDVG